MITPGVCDDEEAGLPERLLDLIGEGSWREPPGDGMGTSVVSKLQDGTLDTVLHHELPNHELPRP